MAVATATSGLARYTSASAVPLLPLKFRLKVLTETAPELGAQPMPMQGPQAFSMILTPARTSSRYSPLSTRCSTTCLEPGLIVACRPACTVRPFNALATIFKSRSEEFVQEPMDT